MSLAPYYPALIILIGAIIVAFGGFWAAWRQTNFNARLNEKNNEIIALQDQQIQYVTGGDSYPLIIPLFTGTERISMSLHASGKYPIYDFQITIVDQDMFALLLKQFGGNSVDWEYVSKNAETTFTIGNMGPDHARMVADFALDKKTGTRNFVINFLARNGHVREEMRLRTVKDKWGIENERWVVALKAYNQQGILESKIDPEYPKDQLWK
jgi:hypothetical protein